TDGFRNRTYVLGRWADARARISASSSRLARVHVHCGCATTSRVRQSNDRVRELCGGQGPGAFASTPGFLSYAHSTQRPAPTDTSHARTPAQTQTRTLRASVRPVRREVSSGRKTT